VLSKEGISSSLNNKSNFVEYAKSSKIAYDYSNNRIILFNSQESYCYVYSLSSGTWATYELNITNTITDYPDTYIQSGNKVRIFSDRIDYDSQKFEKTLLVTRPIKMDDDSYKTIYEVVVRGAYDRNEGAVLLWGSHDGITYSFITDSLGNRIYRTGGTAYRYYRIGVVGNMKVGEKIKLCSVRFRKKYQNRLR
jgi:hypothetical protein